MTENPTCALTEECKLQYDNCNYTAASFIIWLRCLRWMRTFFNVAPIVCGAIATWKVLEAAPITAAVFTLLTTALPPAYRASKTNDAIEDYTVMAGEFTNLRDRFRQLANISSQKPFEEFEADARIVLDRLETARNRALAPPEWCFKLTRKKIKAGHYDHGSNVHDS